MKKFCGIVTLAILCLSVVSLFSFTVNAQQADSWPMFHGDVAHTGYSNTQGLAQTKLSGSSKQTAKFGLPQLLPTASSISLPLTERLRYKR